MREGEKIKTLNSVLFVVWRVLTVRISAANLFENRISDAFKTNISNIFIIFERRSIGYERFGYTDTEYCWRTICPLKKIEEKGKMENAAIECI